MTKGAPVRDYADSVSLEDSAEGGTRVSWDVQFRPLVPGTVLDAIAASSGR